MARPSNKTRIWKRLKDAVSRAYGAFTGEYQGRPTIESQKLERTSSSTSRLLAEKPARSHEDFTFIQDILSTCPPVEDAISTLSQDAAVDENGDDRGWAAIVKVDPLDSDDPDDENKENKKRARQLRRELQLILDRFVARTRIGYKTESFTKKFLSAGDCFAELDIRLDLETGMGFIAGMKELPTWQMFPMLDSKGNVIGYRQQPSDKKNPVIWSIPAQVIHWKINGCDYFPFGQSELLPLKNKFEQLKLIELDLLAAAHSRAVAPEVHYIGRETLYQDTSDEELREYRRKLQEDPTDVTRYYVVKKGQTEIDVLQGDSKAVEVLMQLLGFYETGMVKALGLPVGQGDVANRHMAATMQASYSRRISSIRRHFSDPLQAVFALEFALHGIDVSDTEALGVRKISIEFRWPDLSETRTSRSTRLVSQYTAGAISLESLLYEMGEQDPEGEIAKILEERSRQILPLGTTDPASPNDEQGKGVPKAPGDEGDDKPQEDDDD
jgi:hypothetical protein